MTLPRNPLHLGHPVGTPVRVRADVRRYQRRSGWISGINTQTYPDGRTYTEIGVSWSLGHQSPDAWFRLEELEAR